jgi:hypothetical protein
MKYNNNLSIDRRDRTENRKTDPTEVRKTEDNMTEDSMTDKWGMRQ